MEGDYDVLKESRDALRILTDVAERLSPGTEARARRAEEDVRRELYNESRLSYEQLHRPVNI